MLKNTDFELYDILDNERVRQISTIELRRDITFLSKVHYEALNNNFINLSNNNNNYYYDNNINKLIELGNKRCHELFNVKYSYLAFGYINEVFNKFKSKYKTYIVKIDNNINNNIDNNINNIEDIINDSSYELLIIDSSCFYKDFDLNLLNKNKNHHKILIDISLIVHDIITKKAYNNIFEYGDYFIIRTNYLFLSTDNTILLSKERLENVSINNINDYIMQIISLKELNSDYYNNYINELNNNTILFKTKLEENNYDFIYNENIPIIKIKYNNPCVNELRSIGININQDNGYIELSLHALTLRGFTHHEIDEVFRLFDQGIKNINNTTKMQNLKQEVISLTRKFPLKK